MKEYKVLYLILNGSPYGGSEKHVVDIVNNIDNKGIDAKLIYSEGNSLIEGINKISITTPMGRGFIDFFKILIIIKNEKPDIIHAHAARALIFARMLKFLLTKFTDQKIKLVSTSHGLWVPPDKKKLQLHRLLHLFKGQDDLTLAVSKYSRCELIEQGYNKDKVKYIYNGIDFSNFNSSRNIKRKVENVTFVGRLTEQKGVSHLMDLIDRESLNRDEIKFEIYGSGHLDTYINDYIKAKNLTNVNVKGHTDNIKDVFLKTDLLIAPSMDEGLPYTLVEAINCGLPVVSTVVGGIPEIVENGKNGFLVKPGDRDGFYRAFSKIKKENIESMSRESIRISQKFALNTMIDSIVYEYEECLK
ncbi:glycosyltransferase family 4 protein [Vibrio sp. TMPB1044]|uniref:glycosyltransferase family 4 protein n=1 Tax=Vibrio sp. TMPB1044 TaxID=3051822 RepID=UPI00255C01E3|nr:glycosyltransferase family 4 protein [Vibrio sp. TMPB1044]MDL5026138.1 glycosyltransferase family 4 protein [Vibrio sp. TMPB1044]MDN5206266.1 glycosyltransferase family 4 protein [Vibrio sp. TMPB1044]